MTIPEEVIPEVYYGISRRRGVLDVSFCPIVRSGGKYRRLVSCKITLSAVSQAVRAKALTGRIASERWATQSVLASGRWVKIRVSSEGIYELSASTLSRMGFSDISRVKLYGYGGRVQQENWTFTGSDRVPDDLNEVPLYRREGSVLFFAEGTVRWTWNDTRRQWVHENQPYSRYSYYFVTEGDAPLAFDSVSATSTPLEEISSVTYHAVRDEDAAAIYSGGRELYDAYAFSNGSSRSFRLEAPQRVEGSSAVVGVGFAASNSSSATNVAVSLGGATLGTFSVRKYGSDENGYESRQTFTTTDLAESNTFSFSVSAGSSVDLTARLNYIRLTYDRRLSAAAEPYAFTPNRKGALTLKIANATANTRVWRIGDAETPPAEMSGTLSGNEYAVNVDDATQRFVVVDISGTYSTPQVVGAVENQNLHADGSADMVIIIPASGKLREQAERLAEAHRTTEGMRVRVVDAGRIYNEFSSGTPDASAYRRYLKMLYDRATDDADLPRYLLLFGDCAWDNRMITDEWSSYDPDDFLLAFEVNDNYNNLSISNISLGTLNSYVTDDFFVWLDDGEGDAYSRNKPDVAVGRFPCHDAATATVLVDKTVAYMNNAQVGAWKNKVFMLGDDINNTLHMRSAERVVAIINNATSSRLNVRKVYWDAYPRTYTGTGYTYPKATTELQEYMSQGALIFNYIGHGSPDQVSHAGVLYKSDFTTTSHGRLPLWIFASCEISPYDTQVEDIGRNALYNVTGGAVAVVCASRSVYSSYNEQLNTYLCQYLLSKDEAGNGMGEALRQAKSALVGSSYSGDATINKLKYVLLGDPALRLSMPRGRVVLDSINGTALSGGGKVRLKAGSLARFSGHVETAEGVADTYSGTVTATVADRLETITCQNNSGDASTMVYQDRPVTVFEGSDSIINGHFTVIMPVPFDISYTDDSGRVSLYAVSTDHAIEANGYNEQFCLNGTDETAAPDTVPPSVFVYLDTPDFMDGGITSSSPVFMADISDNVGINMSGRGTGHDMELTIDGNTAQAEVLNSYFTYTFADYTSGQVTYPLSGLERGAHTLSFTVWDVNNNPTTATLGFYVGENVAADFDVNVTQNPARVSTNFVSVNSSADAVGGTLTLEVYDIAGRRVWARSSPMAGGYDVFTWQLVDGTGRALPAGLYLYRARLSTTDGVKETDSKKIIITRQ